MPALTDGKTINFELHRLSDRNGDVYCWYTRGYVADCWFTTKLCQENMNMMVNANHVAHEYWRNVPDKKGDRAYQCVPVEPGPGAYEVTVYYARDVVRWR